MDCRERLEQYLREQDVPFRETPHQVAYTAQELAASEHIPGKLVAKVVVVKTERGLDMLVLPAPWRVDLQQAAAALGVPQVELASEREFGSTFTDCEVGAMPPFGNLYDMPTFVERALTEDPEITFPAGTHTMTLTVPYADFERVVKPQVASFAVGPRLAAAGRSHETA